MQYDTLPSVSKVLDEGISTLRNEIVCFNMGSVIIKPVQRILKYSLILGELLKVNISVGFMLPKILTLVTKIFVLLSIPKMTIQIKATWC